MIRFRPRRPRPIPLHRVTFPTTLPPSYPLHGTILRLDYAICIARVNYLCGPTVASAIIVLSSYRVAGASPENNEFVLETYGADDCSMIDLTTHYTCIYYAILLGTVKAFGIMDFVYLC